MPFLLPYIVAKRACPLCVPLLLGAAVIDRICAAVALSEITAVTPGLVGGTKVTDDTFVY